MCRMLPLTIQNIQFIGSTGCHKDAMIAMMEFAAHHKIQPQIEKFPLTQKGVTDAMARLKEGKMRYRGVVVREDLL